MEDSQKNPDGGNCDMDYRRNVLAPALARIAARAHKAEDKRAQEQAENARWQDGRIHKAH